MKPIAIYLILDDAEAPRYVGKTFYPYRRKLEHSRRFHWVYSVRVLEWITDHDAVRWQDRERYWIAYYRRFAKLENIAKGGGNSGIKSPDTIRRFREKMLGRRQSPDVQLKVKATIQRRTPEQQAAIGRKISESKRGRSPVLSDAERQRRVTAARGNKNRLGKSHSPETRRIISEKSRGHAPNSGCFQAGVPQPKSEEWRAKVSRALKGKVVSVETRAKLREANLGKRASDETKAKMRAAQQARYQ